MEPKLRILLALSGGLDSTTLLAHLINKGYSPECVSFTYGSKHNPIEREAARKVAKEYGVPLDELDITPIMKNFKSDLMKTGGEIPTGHYNDDNMKKTVVPSRNMIFISLLSGLAESRGIPYIAIGVHQGDHHIYPDCRPDFINSMKYSVIMASDNKVRLIPPFLHENKQSIVKIGSDLKVPFHLTRTCYTDDPVACGECGSCRERLEAFQLNGLKDPLPYKNQKYV